MGGQVKVIFREADGAIHVQNRWTNNLPFFVKNYKFFGKDEEYIKSFIAKCTSQNNGKTSEPIDYGIVVFDFVKNVIITCQGYSGFSFISNLFVNAYLEKDWKFFLNNEGYTPDELEGFKKFFTNKRVTSYNVRNKNGVIEKMSIDSSDTKVIKDLFDSSIGKNICGFNLDMSPFELIRYPDGVADGFEKAKEKMLELGFVFSKEENELWNKFTSKINKNK